MDNGNSPPDAARSSFLRRLLFDPIRAQLTQGITPERIAFTLAVGTACSVLPFIGFTSLLNLGVGLWLRLNQPILQTLNQLLTPLQLLLIIPYVRLGETLYRSQANAFTVTEMLRIFRDETIGAFLTRFGLTGLHAFTAWLLSVPLLIVCIYFPLRRVLISSAARLGSKQMHNEKTPDA